ncbi:MAG: hypothetical protein EA397_08465 [Deltaproteobacteria bacterium]|nr:MAG: hypothetical protein EA397_08465 [Deltaproteobacteria bacterium]
MVGARVVLVGALSLASVAQAAEVELRLLAPEIEVGQTGAVRIIVRGGQPTALPKINVEPQDGVELRFERHSPQVVISNSRVTRYHEYLYRVTAQEPGRYTVGPAEVEIGRRSLASTSATLQVLERSDVPLESVTAHAGFEVDHAYVGQVVVYRRGLRSPTVIHRDIWTTPPLDGLITPRDAGPAYAEYALQGASGPVYVKEEFFPKVVVTAEQREVPGASVRVEVGDPRARPPSRIGLRTRRQQIATPTKSLDVRALPPSPRDFSGLIGEYAFSAELDRTRAAVGESVNLTVKVQGDGTLEGFSLARPREDLPLKIYDGSPSTSSRVDAGGFRSEGSFSRVLVPTRPGRIELPPIEVIAFDPSKEDYVTHTVPLPALEVQAGRGDEAVAAEQFLDDDVDPDAVELAPAFEGVRDPRPTGWVHLAWLGGVIPWMLGLTVLPLVLLGVGEGGRVSWGILMRFWRRPREVAMTPRQRLARLPEEPEARLAALDEAFRLALARAVEVPVAQLDRREAFGALSPELGERARELSGWLDRVRFAGQEAGDIESQITAMVEDLERFGGGR